MLTSLLLSAFRLVDSGELQKRVDASKGGPALPSELQKAVDAVGPGGAVAFYYPVIL